MSFHRAIFVAVATFVTVGMTSGAFAGCGGCGGWSSCTTWDGGCGAGFAPTTHAVPVTTYEQPLAPAPIGVAGCGCRGLIAFEAARVSPSPVYVVNRGPEYSGPGIMEPYRIYAPSTQYAPTASYPYIPGYGPHPRYPVGPHITYREHGYDRPHQAGPRAYRPAPHWHLYPHHP